MDLLYPKALYYTSVPSPLPCAEINHALIKRLTKYNKNNIQITTIMIIILLQFRFLQFVFLAGEEFDP